MQEDEDWGRAISTLAGVIVTLLLMGAGMWLLGQVAWENERAEHAHQEAQSRGE